MRLILSLSLCLALLAAPAVAVQPDEVLSDAGLEARARLISRDLRCPVCQSENIDDSNADISRDLRLLVRERLVAGDTDAQVIDYVVDRYGEYVLFNPRARGSNLALWLAGPAMLLVGGGLAFGYLRRRKAEVTAAGLTQEEETRLREILKQ
ncbi:MAG: cytochrome C biogenesis protein CcdA [Rhodobacteraceae bacterium GWE1_64_9]|nr:MAG: cytochrome C biogenesis protein CcdA [Rhodobacteraceae bacterium GWE1_64_9]HBU14626.1 cytochrome C biogenesis protein CcdA [Gemmobacter sp.]